MKNFIIYFFCLVSMAMFLIGCYTVGYHVAVLRGIALIAISAAYLSAVLGVNRHVC